MRTISGANRARFDKAEYREPILYFHPLVLFKMMAAINLHAGLEVGGFLELHPKNLMYVVDIHFPKQAVSGGYVDFDKDDICRLQDEWMQNNPDSHPACIRSGWYHHHPFESNTPSSTDETTFREEFGPNAGVDFGIMLISCKEKGSPVPRLGAHIQMTTCGVSVVIKPEVQVVWSQIDDLCRTTDFSMKQWTDQHRPLIQPIMGNGGLYIGSSNTGARGGSSGGTSDSTGRYLNPGKKVGTDVPFTRNSYQSGTIKKELAVLSHKLSDRFYLFKMPSGIWYLHDRKVDKDGPIAMDASLSLAQGIEVAEAQILIIEDNEALEQKLNAQGLTDFSKGGAHNLRLTSEAESLVATMDGGFTRASPQIKAEIINGFRTMFDKVGTRPSAKLIDDLVKKIHDMNPGRTPNYALAAAEWMMKLDAPTMATILKAYQAHVTSKDIVPGLALGAAMPLTTDLAWLFKFFEAHKHQMPNRDEVVVAGRINITEPSLVQG